MRTIRKFNESEEISNVSDVMNSDFSLTLTKQELFKLIIETYAEGFDKGGKTSHDLLKKGKCDMDNVKLRNDFIKSKFLELRAEQPFPFKFGEK